MRTYFGQIADQKYSNKENAERIFNILVHNIGNIKEGSNILLAFLGHPKYYKLALKRFPNCKISILEDISLKQGYDFCSYIPKSDIIYIDFNDEQYLYYIENLYKLNMGFKDKKFDIVVGNPPYNKNLHLRIIEAAITLLKEDGKGCFIHPVTWLKNSFNRVKISGSIKTFSKLIQKILNIEYFDNAEKTNELFKISFNGCLGVSQFSNSPVSDDISRLNQQIKYDEFNDYLINKLNTYKDNVLNHETLIKGQYFVPVINKFLAASKKGTYLLPTENGKYAKSNYVYGVKDSYTFINFDSENEANNFKKFITSKLIRAIYGKLLYNDGSIIERMSRNLIPYFGDYTHEWSDKEIQNELGLTDNDVEKLYKYFDSLNVD